MIDELGILHKPGVADWISRLDHFCPTKWGMDELRQFSGRYYINPGNPSNPKVYLSRIHDLMGDIPYMNPDKFNKLMETIFGFVDRIDGGTAGEFRGARRFIETAFQIIDYFFDTAPRGDGPMPKEFYDCIAIRRKLEPMLMRKFLDNPYVQLANAKDELETYAMKIPALKRTIKRLEHELNGCRRKA